MASSSSWLPRPHGLFVLMTLMSRERASPKRKRLRREKMWGAEHTSTLNTVNNLGNLYKDQGKMVEAEAMYLRALQGYENALGAEHTMTRHTVHDLSTPHEY